jgi:hypothetical protein
MKLPPPPTKCQCTFLQVFFKSLTPLHFRIKSLFNSHLDFSWSFSRLKIRGKMNLTLTLTFTFLSVAFYIISHVRKKTPPYE